MLQLDNLMRSQKLLNAVKNIYIFRSLAYFNRIYFCLRGRDNCSKTNAFQWRFREYVAYALVWEKCFYSTFFVK